jgi:predicted phage tail protein
LLVTIKPHSAFKNFFYEKEYKADLKTYNDIFFYLNGMHKHFVNYLRKQKTQGIDEGFVLLDKNLKVINPDEFKFKHLKDGDIVYIVPAIVGGGGKRGGLLAILAVAMFIFLPMLAPAAGGLGGAGTAAGTAATTAGTAAAKTGIFAGKLGGFLQQIVVNIGLALLSSLFASKPKEEETRQNDMFGSLTNSTGTGTPISLNYGMVRVAGHMINGYVLSLGHAKTQHMNIYGEIIPSESTSNLEQEQKRSEFLEGFNSYT